MPSKLLPAKFGVPCRPGSEQPLTMVRVTCCICEHDDPEPMATGEDFEYRTSPDSFLVVRCRSCGLVYHNPRPENSELDRIYPPDYHAYAFTEEQYGFIYKVRRKLESRRLLSACKGLAEDAHILDIGCGDGFHLSLLKDFGRPGWQLEGIDPSPKAVQAGARKGLKIHQGIPQQLNLPKASYDMAILIATIEHVDDPVGVLRAVHALLKPGGRVLMVTDNTDTLHFSMFKSRYWGGYHYPRHWNLFDFNTVRALARKTGLEVASLSTIVSPVNWVYSIHNLLVDKKAPKWLVNRFTLNSTISLAIFTIVDTFFQWLGKGTLLRVMLKRPS